jgi:RND family efflux transporter MFP subunit
VETRITASGSVLARRTTEIGAELSGRLIEIRVDVGDRVEAGAPLFQIDPEPYRIALEEAEAGLALARAEASQARDEAARTGQLAKKNMVAQQQHDRTRTQAAVARARVKQWEARTLRARHDLERTLVTAPYAGSIVERRADEGAIVTPGPGSVVVVLQESGSLEAVLDIPEASRTAVRVNDAARLFVEGLPQPLEARVSTVSDRIDDRSRTSQIRVPVEDATGTMKAGAFVRAEITPTPRRGALVVDRSAVLASEGRTFLWRIRGDRVEQVPVQLGASGTSLVEVLSGANAGDLVVIGEAVARLADGDRVAPETSGGGASSQVLAPDLANVELARPDAGGDPHSYKRVNSSKVDRSLSRRT